MLTETPLRNFAGTFDRQAMAALFEHNHLGLRQRLFERRDICGGLTVSSSPASGSSGQQMRARSGGCAAATASQEHA
jgi:hypothetical protein